MFGLSIQHQVDGLATSQTQVNLLLIAEISKLQKRIEELESRVKELENATSPTGGSGAGHYGAGPWG